MLPTQIVNAGFRKGECGFLQMADIIEETMAKATFDSIPTSMSICRPMLRLAA